MPSRISAAFFIKDPPWSKVADIMLTTYSTKFMSSYVLLSTYTEKMFLTIDSKDTKIEKVSRPRFSSSTKPRDTMIIWRIDCGNASNTDSSSLRTLQIARDIEGWCCAYFALLTWDSVETEASE